MSGEAGLVGVVGTEFAFNGFSVLFGADSFSAVVEFDDERKSFAVAVAADDKSTIGVDDEWFGFQFYAVLACEVQDFAVVLLGCNAQVNDRLGKAERVMMVAGSDRFEVASFG